jgi:hypothetical protein
VKEIANFMFTAHDKKLHAKDGGPKCSCAYYGAVCLILASFASGWLVNFTPWLNTAKLILFIACIFLLCGIYTLATKPNLVIENKKAQSLPAKALSSFVLCVRQKIEIGNVFLALIFFVLYLLAIVFSEIANRSFNSSYLFMLATYLYCPICGFIAYVSLNKREARKIANVIIWLTVFSSIYAILQVKFSALLPMEARYVSSTSIVNELMISGDSSYVRANGMIGNTIEFGGLTTIVFLVVFSRIIKEGINAKRVIAALIIFAANYLTSSRVYFGLLLLFSFFIFLRCSKLSTSKKVIIIVVLAVLGVLVIVLFGNGSLMVQRLLGNDSTALASNKIHSEQIAKILEIIRENLILGTGVCTQVVGADVAITDGWFFQLTGELGLFGLASYVCFFVFTFRTIRGNKREPISSDSVASLCIIFVFAIASFFNSGFIGRVPYLLMFMLLASGTLQSNLNKLENKAEAKNGKICIISLDCLNRVPYISRYESALRGVDVDLLYWNRSGLKETSSFNVFSYDRCVLSSESKQKRDTAKLKGYIKFLHFCNRWLLNNDYAGVVFLHGPASVFVSNDVREKYKNKILIDVRDFTYENHFIYRIAQSRAFSYASLILISSPAYKHFLPRKYTYHMIHNFQNATRFQTDAIRKTHTSAKDGCIRIACVGSQKNPQVDLKVINSLANDDRFHLLYAGRGFDSMINVCKKHAIKNVSIVGEFPSEQTFVYYKGADVVMNLYGSGSPLWDYALSNKLYLAAQMGLPILVCKGTTMARISAKYGFGIAVDVNSDTLANDIEKQYKRINFADLHKGCDAFLKDIAAQDSKADALIRSFAMGCISK